MVESFAHRLIAPSMKRDTDMHMKHEAVIDNRTISGDVFPNTEHF
jgi:hypothetical protein